MELTKALELEDPTKYESNLPVHQDGTCNGLQHYAALGGDSVGAQQVNLSVTERPSDVYTYVANMVEKTIEKDILKGNEAAKLLKGRIARKVVKQTVRICFSVPFWALMKPNLPRNPGHDHCVRCHVRRSPRPDREAASRTRRPRS